MLVENDLQGKRCVARRFKTPDGPENPLPAGTPEWMTPQLINSTLQTWQPFYQQRLTIGDAIEILRSTGLLIDLLGNCHEEELSSARACVQPRTGT